MSDARPIRVFISYSHDSPDHVEAIRRLSDRLRDEGIDCHIDQYEMSPPEGWPTWMYAQLESADFVLCVCTSAYQRRVLGVEEPGRGLGARWEGAIITQVLYQAAANNRKFIPVIRAATDTEHIPYYLSGATRYALDTVDGYDRLYRHITSQPLVPKPALGSLRELAPTAARADGAPSDASGDVSNTVEAQTYVLLMSRSHGLVIVEAESIESADAIVLRLLPGSQMGVTFLEALHSGRDKDVSLSFALTGLMTTVEKSSRTVAGGREIWTLTLRPRASEYGAGIMEMATAHFSADALAEMRARRILLDERLEVAGVQGREKLNDAMLEVLVRGLNTPLEVEASPLPELYEALGANPEQFLAGARLVAVLWLRLSGVVEFIHRLELRFQGTEEVEVSFRGVRPRKYTNQDPPTIAVEGICNLARA